MLIAVPELINWYVDFLLDIHFIHRWWRSTPYHPERTLHDTSSPNLNPPNFYLLEARENSCRYRWCYIKKTEEKLQVTVFAKIAFVNETFIVNLASIFNVITFCIAYIFLRLHIPIFDKQLPIIAATTADRSSYARIYYGCCGLSPYGRLFVTSYSDSN